MHVVCTVVYVISKITVAVHHLLGRHLSCYQWRSILVTNCQHRDQYKYCPKTVSRREINSTQPEITDAGVNTSHIRINMSNIFKNIINL